MAMLRRMTAATAVGEGLDGFDLGIIAVVLPLITADLGLTPVWSGLIAASTLVGIFFGSPIVGWLSDRIDSRPSIWEPSNPTVLPVDANCAANAPASRAFQPSSSRVYRETTASRVSSERTDMTSNMCAPEVDA